MYNYRIRINNKNKELMEQFAEIRAIYFAFLHGAVTHEKAKLLTAPVLQKLNTYIGLTSKKYGVTPKYITFEDLGAFL